MVIRSGEMDPQKSRRLARWSLIPAFVLVLAPVLLVCVLAKGPASISGQRVFDGTLIVRPPRPGDTHRIGEQQARNMIDRGDPSLSSSEPPRLLMFGFARVTAPLVFEGSPLTNRPVWIGVYHVPASAIAHGCPSAIPDKSSVGPEPPNHFYFAIIVDPSRGKETIWYGDDSAYMEWSCASGRSGGL
jgi:hypothetical protein